MTNGSQDIQQEGRQRQNGEEAQVVGPQRGEGQGGEMAEEWRPVVGYEGLYEVSNMGQIRSLARFGFTGRSLQGKLFTPSTGSHGYRMVSLRLNGSTKKACVSRLVAGAFIERREGTTEVNHINGIKSDDGVKNLEWVTSGENKKHAYDTGLKKAMRPEDCRTAVLTSEKAEEIRSRLLAGDSRTCLAKEYGVGVSAISHILQKRTWKI